ncbi:hypothetical protein [Clostridium weizhouense]|uniref:hypothetical protein n=1 Tax=Clostridium weizhouense TaxID=2859781 RepID=UPI0021566770|nr:hypothetical protein [Clostridium weizhouense]
MKSKLIIILVILSLGITSILDGCNNTTMTTNSENKTDLSDNQTINDSDSKKTSSIENETKDDTSKKVVDTTKEKETSKNSTKKSNEYEITSEIYTKNNVKINYPQIKNLNDSEKLKSINKDLQEEALNSL